MNIIMDCPRRLSAATTRITRGHYAITHGHYADSPRSIRGLSASIRAAVHAEQPRNSAEKVKFSVSHTVYVKIGIRQSSPSQYAVPSR